MSGDDDTTNRPVPGNRTDRKEKNLENERTAERENDEAAEGERVEKTPNPGHPT